MNLLGGALDQIQPSRPIFTNKNGVGYALYQAALIASGRNSNFIRYFTKTLKGREKERGIKVKMRVKLAAKMLIIAWTLMKKRIDFDPDFLLTEK